MSEITTVFDTNINAYIVTLPESISLQILTDWGAEFATQLGNESGRVNFLFDFNTHHFESIACLKWLRDFLGSEQFTSTIHKAAFVQPVEYRPPEIVSDSEAYFASMKDALEWLQSCH